MRNCPPRGLQAKHFARGCLKGQFEIKTRVRSARFTAVRVPHNVCTTSSSTSVLSLCKRLMEIYLWRHPTVFSTPDAPNLSLICATMLLNSTDGLACIPVPPPRPPKTRPPARRDQRPRGRLGGAFVTPAKYHAPGRNSRIITLLGNQAKRKLARARLEKLLATSDDPFQDEDTGLAEVAPSQEPDAPIEGLEDPSDMLPMPVHRNTDKQRQKNKIEEDARTLHYWQSLLPTILASFICYLNGTNGRPTAHARPADCIGRCLERSCTRMTTSILCLYLECAYNLLF